MPPKRGAKAGTPAAAAPAKPATASAAAASKLASAGPGSASAELLKECDKALAGVRSGAKKSVKAVADLLGKQPCSLTFRTNCAALLISALLEPGNTKKHLAAACAASSKAVSAEPACVHLEVMNAVTHHRRACALTYSLIKERFKGSALDPDSECDATECARLVEEGRDAWTKASTLVATLEHADFSTASLEVLEQEKRMVGNLPDALSALAYRAELKAFLIRYGHDSRCELPSFSHPSCASQAAKRQNVVLTTLPPVLPAVDHGNGEGVFKVPE